MLGQLDTWTPGVDLVAAVDPQRDTIVALGEGRYDKVAWYDDIVSMLDATAPDGVMIGTTCNLHTDLAVEVLGRGLPLFLEKPVAIDSDQLVRLEAAGRTTSSPTVVSFPLRVSELCLMAKEVIDSGAIGRPQHASAINHVPWYSKIYYQGWMRDEALTGGLWLQKATHDLDYLTFLLGAMPTRVTAVESKTVFTGEMPRDLHCRDCALQETCPESQLSAVRNLEADSVAAAGAFLGGDWRCAFAPDTGNHDSATAVLQYESGAHAVYSQVFYARHGSARRGITVVGYEGSVSFDWYADELQVHHHHKPRSERRTVQLPGRAHFGGDAALAHDFYGIVTGKGETRANLADGIASARLCLAAKESCRTGSAVTL